MDAAYYEAALSFEAGADYVTFLALTDDESVAECVRAAHDYDGLVVADMICVPDLPARARELAALDLDLLAVHTEIDQQALGRTPWKTCASSPKPTPECRWPSPVASTGTPSPTTSPSVLT
jgi:3-hexulose-6-phosphate synthase